MDYLKLVKNPTDNPTDNPTVLFNQINEREQEKVKKVWGFVPNSKDCVELKILVEKFPHIRELRDILEHCEKFRS